MRYYLKWNNKYYTGDGWIDNFYDKAVRFYKDYKRVCILQEDLMHEGIFAEVCKYR